MAPQPVRSPSWSPPRRYVASASAAALVLVQILVSLADLKRGLFVILSILSAVLLLALAVWYFHLRDYARGAMNAAGVVVVILLAAFGLPSDDSSAAIATGTGVEDQSRSDGPSPGSATEPETPTPDGVVVEEPSEANAIFTRSIDCLACWHTTIRDAMQDQTVDDVLGEGLLAGSWYALADLCLERGDGSTGRCYDLAALYIAETFDRDPRTINQELWYAAGAVGAVLDDGYRITARHIGTRPRIVGVDDDRPGIAWECEPTCTAGYVISHPDA